MGCSCFSAMEQTSGPHRRWGGAKAPYERFCKAKTSAQAEFTSAEHDEKLGPHKISLCGRLLHGHHHRGAGVKKYIDRSTLRGAPVFCKGWSPWERFCPTHFFCLAKTESRPRFPGQAKPDCFFWRIQKKWFLEKSVPKAKPLDSSPRASALAPFSAHAPTKRSAERKQQKL